MHLPLQHDLQALGQSSILLPTAGAVLAFAAVVLVSDAWMRARHPPPDAMARQDAR